jgi:hypothetical protein
MPSTLLIHSFIKELDSENRATTLCLERIPETLWEYKPHPYP